MDTVVLFYDFVIEVRRSPVPVLREDLNKETMKLVDLSSSSFLIFEPVYSGARNQGQTMACRHAASTTNATCGDGQVTHQSLPDATPCPHGPQTGAGGSNPSVGPGTGGGPAGHSELAEDHLVACPGVGEPLPAVSLSSLSPSFSFSFPVSRPVHIPSLLSNVPP